MDRVFSAQWFCVGRQEEIPEPGDHLVCEVVGESVLVTRNGVTTTTSTSSHCASWTTPATTDGSLPSDWNRSSQPFAANDARHPIHER